MSKIRYISHKNTNFPTQNSNVTPTFLENENENKNRGKNVYRNIFLQNISDFIELDIFIQKYNNKPQKILENLQKYPFKTQKKNENIKNRNERKIGLFEFVI